MLSKKRRLSEEDSARALMMLDRKISLGKVARYFGVNKPSILKSVNMWKSELKKAPDGGEFLINRGKVVVVKRPELKKEKNEQS